jgi:hypothetical protein
MSAFSWQTQPVEYNCLILNELNALSEKCDELRVFDTQVFWFDYYNRHTEVPRLPGPGPGVHRKLLP